MCFIVVICIWFINLNFRDALNRASVVPSRTSSPTQSVGMIPSRRSNGSVNASGSGSRHGSASTVFIPADEDMLDVGSTLTQSSFRSVSMDSPRHSDVFPLSALSSFYRRYLLPFAWPTALVSLRRAHRGCSQREFLSSPYEFYDRFGLICQHRCSSLGNSPKHFRFRHASLAVPWSVQCRLQRSGSTQDYSLWVIRPSAPSPNRPLPGLPPTLSSIPSMLSLRSERTSDRCDTAAGFTTTVRHRHGSSPTVRREPGSSVTTAPRDPSSARRYDTPLGTTRSPSTVVPLAVAGHRQPAQALPD
jgi:hypothetical protein